MTVRGRWSALALAALMLAGMVLSGGFVRTGDRSFFLPEQEGYERYENTAVKFALDVPEDYELTGPYQAEGYTFYETRCEGAPVEFFTRDGVQVEEYDSWIDIYPEDHAFTEASVGIVQTVYEPADELETVMDAMCTSFFDLYDDTRYAAQPSHFDLGRYSYDLAALEYYDEGVRYSVSIALFVSGDHYWRVTAKTTDEYAEQVAAVFSDTLFSLRVNGDVALSGQEEPDGQGELARTAGNAGGVGAVLDVIEAQEGFTGGSNGFMAPIGFVTELDGGGRLLAVVYELKDGSGNGELYTVSADAWLIGDGSAVLLARSELYKELGGNSGSVSIARKDGVVYLEMECHLWEGDRFNNYYAYMPLNETEARFDEAVYMEGHGTVGEEDQGQYIVGDDEVTRAGFDDARAAYVFDPGMTLDIQQGPGNGDVMDFDALRRWYPD